MSAIASPSPSQRYRFVVKSAEEAAGVIRERLGEQARVISVRQIGGEGLARFLRAPKLEVIAELPGAEPEPAPAMPAPREAATTAPREGRASADRISTVLEKAGLRHEFLSLIDQRPGWRDLRSLPLHSALAKAALLLRDAVPGRPVALGNRAAFFGSAGAGVTTALCKQLTADVFLKGRSACVMKLDADEPNSTEGLATFCEALGVPLLRSPAEILEVSDEATVYFDLPGGSQADSALERTMADLAIESRVLVVNAAYERELIQQAYARATRLGGTHVVFTHLDELSRCGKLWEFVLEGSLAPLFGSTGPNVAGDCERDLVDLLVRRTLGAARL
jgi:flagellar biosynthesis protein FlhF